MTIETFNASTSWVCPTGITTVDVECWGGGGGGGNGSYVAPNRFSGGSGGGGAYAKKNAMGVTPSSSYTVNIGTGGIANGVRGGDSWFDTSGTVRGRGGNSGSGSSLGTGGSIANSVGDVRFAGGTGSNGIQSSVANQDGRGGGSSAGTAANGTAAASIVGAVAPSGGGNGGDGGTSAPTNGSDGLVPGGGAGGGGSTTSTQGTGGKGAVGQVVLTYTAVTGGPFPHFIQRAMRGGMITLSTGL